MVPGSHIAELQELDRRHYLHPFSDHRQIGARGTRLIERGEGVYVYDASGHKILDGMSGLWCVNLGYGRQELIDAACRQLAARARANVRAARPRGATGPPARSGEIETKHAELLSAFQAAIQSGDLEALTELLASDVRVVTDGGGKVASALNVIEGADRVARFLLDATRRRPGAWWRADFRLRPTINGLPGVIVDAPEGPVQTAAFEIDGGVVRALYVVRNPDKLRHLAPAP